MNTSVFVEKDLRIFIDSLPSLEGPELPEAKLEEAPSPEKAPSCDEQSASCPSPLFDELINYIKENLAAMKSFASLSRDAFKDAELGKRYYKTICADIEKTMSVLNCYCDYLRFSNPVRANGTIQMLIEEVLKVHGRQLKEKNITIINKQFEEDLPETAMPDSQLRYVLETMIQYNLLSLPHHSSLGFLTRLYDHSEGNGHGQNRLEKDRQYIEILVVSSHPEKPKGSSAGVAAGNNGAGADLMLELVKEVIRKNHGVMKIKSYDPKGMTFNSLILPVERSKVAQFPSPNHSDEMNQMG
jgi:nitrogen-specific signal transduction histidine kinase